MAYNLDNYSFSAVDSITGFERATGECLFILEELKSATINGDAELVWSTGREGRRLSSLKRNKTFSISGQNGFISGGLLSQQIGDLNPEEATDVPSILMPTPPERRPVSDDGATATTLYEASGPIGNEIGLIYKANSDGSPGQKFAQAATASASEFAYDPATKIITLPLGVFSKGDLIVVFYKRLTKGRKYSNRSDSYGQDVMLLVDIMSKDICTSKEIHTVLEVPKATMSDTFSYSFGGDMAVQDFSAEAASTICGETGERVYFNWYFPMED